MPTKRRQAMVAQFESGKIYAVLEAIRLIKRCATAKFVESVDVAVRLGVDVRQSDQIVRGATVLPHGTGKVVRVAVFARGEQALSAEAAGADRVGYEDLADIIRKGDLSDIDVVIATPESMRIVGQLGPILGPRGLMPNPKVGTVTTDVATAVKNVKGGQVRYRTDKNGIIHCNIGKADFDDQALQENLEALLLDLKKAKPATAKGVYWKSLVLTSTMGLGWPVELASLNVML